MSSLKLMNSHNEFFDPITEGEKKGESVSLSKKYKRRGNRMRHPRNLGTQESPVGVG